MSDIFKETLNDINKLEKRIDSLIKEINKIQNELIQILKNNKGEE